MKNWGKRKTKKEWGFNMKRIIFLSLIFIIFKNSFASIDENEFIELKKTITEVMESEKKEEESFLEKNNINFSLIRSNKKNEKEEKENLNNVEEVTLKTLQAEIKELKEILKNNLEGELEIGNYIPAEDYLDFKDRDEEEKISLSNYTEYIYNFTKDYELAREINKNVMIYSKSYEVSPELILSIIKEESGFDPTIVSPKGAYGLMQLMEETANYLSVDRKTISDNIKGGTKFIKKLLDEYNNDLVLALASYNAGLGAVQKFNGVPPYEETKNYIERVMQNMSKITKNEIIIDSIDFDNKKEVF